MTSLIGAQDSELKPVYDAFAAFGKHAKGEATFASKDFAKFVRDAGFWTDKGNKFNTKPPNRVDFVFTYACTNGPGGGKGNKKMEFGQFLVAIDGIGKEIGLSRVECRARAAKATPQAHETTKVKDTRFFNEHREGEQGADFDAAATRRQRTLKGMSGEQYSQAMARQKEVEAMFYQYDADGSGELDIDEVGRCLKALKPEATREALGYVKRLLMSTIDTNHDGKLSFEEFTSGYNRLVELLGMMGDGGGGAMGLPEEKQLLMRKFNAFAEFGADHHSAGHHAAGGGTKMAGAKGADAHDAELDSAHFKQFCEQVFSECFPRRSPDASAAIDLIYTEALKHRRLEGFPAAKKIRFAEFYTHALLGIAKKSNMPLPDVHRRILCSEGPIAHGATAQLMPHDPHHSHHNTTTNGSAYGAPKSVRRGSTSQMVHKAPVGEAATVSARLLSEREKIQP